MRSAPNMARHPSAAVLGLACCICALLLAGAPALAQADAATNATNGTLDDPNEPDEELADQLGDLTVHEYSYSDGQMTIQATWTGATPETVTLTEMIELDSEGSTAISFQQQRLIPGERTEITMAVEERSSGTAAVLLTTPQGTERNEALVLQAGEPTNWPTIGLDSAIAATGLSAAGAAAFTFVFVLRRKHAEEWGVSRKA